jgi:hypothetical protein
MWMGIFERHSGGPSVILQTSTFHPPRVFVGHPLEEDRGVNEIQKAKERRSLIDPFCNTTDMVSYHKHKRNNKH